MLEYRNCCHAMKAILAALLLAGGAGLTEHAQAQVITLRVADSLPPSHFITRNGTNYFMEEVTKATNGTVRFEHYPSEQLGKAKDMLTALQSGVADIALVVPSYMSEKLPLSGVVDLPGGIRSSCQGTFAYAALLEDGGWLAENEFKPNKVRAVFTFVNPPYELFLSKKGRPNLLDLEGRKVRSVGGALDLTVRDMKGVPVRLSAPEIREALSRGTVDGVIWTLPSITAYKLDSLVKSATRGAKLSSIATTYMISDAAWAKLPETARKAMVRIGQEATRRTCDMTDKDIDTIYAQFEKQGIDVFDVTSAEQQALTPVFEKVRQDWVTQLTQRGKPGKEALAAFEKALAATK